MKLQSNLALTPSVVARADTLLREHQLSIAIRTDRLLAGLLEFEWGFGIILALWRSPLTWHGGLSSIHPHVIAAVFLGAVLLPVPILLSLVRPGESITRHSIAIAHMLMSSLLIHLGGGQIEMHFQIFGTLAFLAFYRDWRVLITATIVTGTDHVVRGLIMPESVFGVLHVSVWLTLEHVAWVTFDDIFLIGSCIRGVNEMRGIAETRAMLEQSYRDVERQVEERTSELKNAQEELMKAARTAGMAEIATSVLHNVGNVLNSVNISATIVADTLKQSEVASLTKVSDMIVEHKPDLARYLTADERGRLIPDFITDLAGCLGEEQASMLNEVQSLSKGIEHIKQIVAAQQSMAKKAHVLTRIKPFSIMETALSMQLMGQSGDIGLTKHYDELDECIIDQHKVLQVLINLLSNARQAVMARPASMRHITLTVERVEESAEERIRFRVKDNGMGIAPENLARIFSHGFTTKKEGHGFGLHSSANAAAEMGGHLSVMSDGVDQGATFTLELPVLKSQEETLCKA
ncbi:MAG: sensor histidine kinase [Tepidisphaeraceae bacterium]